MGCVASNDDSSSSPKNRRGSDTTPATPVKNGGTDITEEAHRQRRRLSLTPQHVGDITKAVNMTRRRASIQAGIEDLDQNELLAKGNLECVMCTKKGMVPYNNTKRNQDRAMVKFGLQGKSHMSLFGVGDGHGEFGHDVAQFVQENLHICLANQANLESNPEDGITKGVAEVVAKLKETGINCAFSGTTLVFAVKINNDIYCANIGDSRCIVVRNKNKVIALSEDQKPENPGEKERILAAGGRVEPLPGPPGVDCGPDRVWLGEVDVPGLAMSRSIGDNVSQTVGVISIPEIMQYKLVPQDRCLVIASDGVWEFITNEEACAIVYKYLPDYQKACDKLCDEATKRWQKEEEVIDDITCVVVGLQSAASSEQIKLQIQ